MHHISSRDNPKSGLPAMLTHKLQIDIVCNVICRLYNFSVFETKIFDRITNIKKPKEKLIIYPVAVWKTISHLMRLK